MSNKIKLYNIDDAEKFSMAQVQDLYKSYINSSQVELISSFGFGNDLVEKSEGLYIYTKNGKKILDFTGGVGVLNHGHNHQKILDARKKFSLKKKWKFTKTIFHHILQH